MRLRLPHRLRTHTVAVNAGLAVLLVGGGAWGVASVRSDGTTGSGATATRTETVARTTVSQTVTASGSIASSQVQGATFDATGTVAHIYVTVGDSVARGAKLAAIDPTTAKQEVRTAEDTLAVAEDTLAQATAAGDTSAIDSAQTQVTAAESGVADAKAALGGTVLTAPIAGTVIACNGAIGGSSAASGSTSSSGSSGSTSGSGSTSSSSATSVGGFIVIANLKAMELDVDVPEADAAKLKTGQAATVDWTALTGATATGTVASIDTTGSTSGGVVTYPVVVTLAKLPVGVRIGQSAAVTITTGTKTDVLAVPNAAVHLDGSAHYVTVTNAEGAAARRVTVTIGLVGDSLTEITGGLVEGQRVTVPITTSPTTSGSTGPGAGDVGGGPPDGSGAGGL